MSDGQNIRRGGRSAWRGLPTHGGFPATSCSAPVHVPCRPSPGSACRRPVAAAFAHDQWRHPAGKEKPAGGIHEPTTAIPARVDNVSVVTHTRLTNVHYCRMRSTITSNAVRGPDVKMLKGGTIVVKFPWLNQMAPSCGSRFGSPLVLSGVHWVRLELVAEVKYLTWTDDNLLRQVVYEGLREDKPVSRSGARRHPRRGQLLQNGDCGRSRSARLL